MYIYIALYTFIHVYIHLYTLITNAKTTIIGSSSSQVRLCGPAMRVLLIRCGGGSCGEVSFSVCQTAAFFLVPDFPKACESTWSFLSLPLWWLFILYIYIYIYIQRERERDKDKDIDIDIDIYRYLQIFIDIYLFLSLSLSLCFSLSFSLSLSLLRSFSLHIYIYIYVYKYIVCIFCILKCLNRSLRLPLTSDLSEIIIILIVLRLFYFEWF